jgi:hypothetical protein
VPRDNSPYIVGDYWLDKRRDGASPDIWQIASGTRSVRYRSTRTNDLNQAKAMLHAYVDAERARGKQAPDTAAAIPLLFLYWKEHGQHADSSQQIASSIRQFIGFLAQDTLSPGLDASVTELDYPLWKRFLDWRMGPHTYEVPWFGKNFKHSSPGVSGESVQRNCDDIGAALNHHVRQGRLTVVPRVPSVPKEHRSAPRDLVLSIDQLGSIVGYCRELGDLGTIRWILLLIATNMRPEAALAMNPGSQWNEAHGLINLHPVGWPVTKKHNPIVPVIPQLVPWLTEWRANPHCPVLSRKKFWRTMRSALGLTKLTVPKTIRHSIATRLRTLRVPAEELETLMGHRTLRSTTGVYAKYDPDYLLAATKALSKVWAEVWVASDRWVAVHMLSRPVRGQELKVLKR